MKGPDVDTTKALQLLPAAVRQRIYLVLASVAAVLTAAAAFFLASPYDVPWWIGAGLAGVGVLAAPFGAIAAANVTKGPAGRRAELDAGGDPVYSDEDPASSS